MARQPEVVFEIDEGFGSRLKVWAIEDSDQPGGGCVMVSDRDRDAYVTIDYSIWDRVVKAVAKGRE